MRSPASADLTEGKVLPVLLRFSVPFMIATLLQTLYTTVDMIVIGQFLGGTGLSAVSNGSQLIQMATMLCVGFANAGQVLLAQSRGAGDQERIRRVTGTLLYLMLGFSLLIGAAYVVFSKGLLHLLGTPREAFDQARAYIVICGGGLLFTGLYNMFSALMRGVGDSRHPMIFVAVASCVNLLLDLLFVARLHWGVAGAAAATVIGQAASVLFCLVFLRARPQHLGFVYRLGSLRYHPKEAATMLRIGIPMSLQSGAIHVSFLFVSALVNTGGVVDSAAFGVTEKLRNLPQILCSGLMLGSSSMIGQNLGARKPERAEKTVRSCILLGLIIMAVFGTLFGTAPALWFRLFTQDEAVIGRASVCILTLLINMPALNVIMPGCNALIQAQGNARLSLVIALFDAFCGRILLSWLLGVVFGLKFFGFILGYSLATYFTAIPVGIYFLSGRWKKRALL